MNLIWKENTMKNLILLFFVIGTVLIFFSCQEESALAPELDQSNQVTNSLAKPAPNLIGTTNTPFNFPPLPDPGGSDFPVFWKGTIVFGKVTYGLYFLSTGPPRDFSQASTFFEYFVIHENGNEQNVYVRAWNAGVVSYANKDPEPVKFRANGKITEAYGPLEAWQGRSVHICGLVHWKLDGSGQPEKAEGTFRIN
jgi:hypothetical protein